MVKTNLPALTDGGLSAYIAQVNSFPMLTQEQEIELANRWVHNQDLEAAQELVTSHLRLVVKMAYGFRGYGLPMPDMISEGNIGLMQAVKRFDPDKGYRLSTYAMWWIKASMHEYVLRSWSMVKMGTTAAQKRLFFNLRRLKNRITGAESRNLIPSEVTKIANDLNVSERDVMEMDQRFSAVDVSLNAPVTRGEESGEWMDFLPDARPTQESIIAESQEKSERKAMLASVLQTLNDRERDIIKKRRLREVPVTLEELSQEYHISRERVRQIETRALEKLQVAVVECAAA